MPGARDRGQEPLLEHRGAAGRPRPSPRRPARSPPPGRGPSRRPGLGARGRRPQSRPRHPHRPRPRAGGFQPAAHRRRRPGRAADSRGAGPGPHPERPGAGCGQDGHPAGPRPVQRSPGSGRPIRSPGPACGCATRALRPGLSTRAGRSTRVGRRPARPVRAATGPAPSRATLRWAAGPDAIGAAAAAGRAHPDHDGPIAGPAAGTRRPLGPRGPAAGTGRPARTGGAAR